MKCFFLFPLPTCFRQWSFSPGKHCPFVGGNQGSCLEPSGRGNELSGFGGVGARPGHLQTRACHPLALAGWSPAWMEGSSRHQGWGSLNHDCSWLIHTKAAKGLQREQQSWSQPKPEDALSIFLQLSHHCGWHRSHEPRTWLWASAGHQVSSWSSWTHSRQSLPLSSAGGYVFDCLHSWVVGACDSVFESGTMPGPSRGCQGTSWSSCQLLGRGNQKPAGERMLEVQKHLAGQSRCKANRASNRRQPLIYSSPCPLHSSLGARGP